MSGTSGIGFDSGAVYDPAKGETGPTGAKNDTNKLFKSTESGAAVAAAAAGTAQLLASGGPQIISQIAPPCLGRPSQPTQQGQTGQANGASPNKGGVTIVNENVKKLHEMFGRDAVPPDIAKKVSSGEMTVDQAAAQIKNRQTPPPAAKPA